MSLDADAPRRDLRAILRDTFSKRMLVAALMGFASGLPLLLTGSLLQAWMTERGVNLGTIGLFALVGLPYTLKFLWAPLMDRFTLGRLGRRRGWLLLYQLLLIVALLLLSVSHPAQAPLALAIASLLVTFFSASQDIVIDAYRRESMADDEQGLGASLYVNGYRIGMLLASGGGLILADHMAFEQVYQLMAAFMLIGVATTVWAPEPGLQEGAPLTMREAVVEPFMEYFQRRDALLILLFILMYKVGDSMASNMTTPFYLDLGFSKTDIGEVVKIFGFTASVAGGLIGGVTIMRIGLYRALFWFGVLQGASTAGFAVLAHLGASIPGLATVIGFETFTGGMGTAAFVAYMAALTNKRFTATQFALLTSLMGVPRVLMAAPTGYLAEALGWSGFFITCSLIAIPGLWLLRRLHRHGSDLREEALA